MTPEADPEEDGAGEATTEGAGEAKGLIEEAGLGLAKELAGFATETGAGLGLTGFGVAETGAGLGLANELTGFGVAEADADDPPKVFGADPNEGLAGEETTETGASRAEDAEDDEDEDEETIEEGTGVLRMRIDFPVPVRAWTS